MQSIDKARALYQATKHVQFCEFPSVDLKDRLALATVAAGLRPFGVLEGAGLQLDRVREEIINHGLNTLVSKSVWYGTYCPPDHPLLPFFRLLDEFHEDTQRVLWVCANAEGRKRLKSTRLTKQEAGLLLAYPECCVEFEVDIGVRANTEFLAALISKVGNGTESVYRALRDNVGVGVSGEVFTLKNIPRTDAQFPFVIHIACDSCLSCPTSPSGQLNEALKQLALDLDPQLHTAISEMQAASANLRSASDTEKDKIFEEMDVIQGVIECKIKPGALIQ